jgi:uncharacterized protein YbbC (DUF1343 family)
MRNPMLYGFLLIFSMIGLSSCDGAQSSNGGNETANDSSLTETPPPPPPTIVGAERLITEYLPEVQGKRIAIVANQTSLVFGGTHLVDSLHALDVDIVRVFAPEHGFRGDHDAGAKVNSDVDEKTGIPLVSLYGRNKKPTAEQLKDVDLVLFDIQDVGARFYTYISTMSYVMEACAEQNIPFFVLDRPNPNGWYVDGPIMRKGHTSFVGIHEGVPIVHGMTVGEYAKMVNQEGWLKNDVKAALTVISCKNYDHSMKWSDTGREWVAPSPNLATEYAAYLYPMLCWFEGMPISVGRGTDSAFTIYGAPWHEGYHRSLQKDSVLNTSAPSLVTLYGLEMESYAFVPRSMPGKATHPKFEGETVWGVRFLNRVGGDSLFMAGLSMLNNLQEESGNVELQKPLFQPFFDNLVGNATLKERIKKMERPEKIHADWAEERKPFMDIRGRYLLYEDFQ